MKKWIFVFVLGFMVTGRIYAGNYDGKWNAPLSQHKTAPTAVVDDDDGMAEIDNDGNFQVELSTSAALQTRPLFGGAEAANKVYSASGDSGLIVVSDTACDIKYVNINSSASTTSGDYVVFYDSTAALGAVQIGRYTVEVSTDGGITPVTLDMSQAQIPVAGIFKLQSSCDRLNVNVIYKAR